MSLLPATIWAVVGYFILFSSTRAQGAVRSFGRALAIWVFVIAAFFPIMGAYVAIMGICPIESIMQSMHAGANS